MSKVQIVYVDKRNGKNGPYTRVGFKESPDSEVKFINVSGHLDLTKGEAEWDGNKGFKQAAQSNSYRPPTPPEDRKSINRSVALQNAVALTSALVRSSAITQDQAMSTVSELFTEMLKLLES